MILIRSDLDPIRFDWSKVDHDRPAAALPALNSQRSRRQYLAKSEEGSSAKLPHTLLRNCVWLQAKLDDLSLSGEAIPLGSCDAKC